MKVIIEHKEKVKYYLSQYADKIECLGSHHKIITIKERYMPWLRELADKTELDFIMELSETEIIDESLMTKENTLFAFIGTKPVCEAADSYYDMAEHVLRQALAPASANGCEYILCCSESKRISAADYIQTVCYLANLSIAYHKPLIIFASLNTLDETNQRDTLTDKIIYSKLEEVKGKLVIVPVKKEKERFVKRNSPLFDEVFYKSIGPDEEIYTVLRFSTQKKPEDYERLGFKVIPLVSNYGMLYGKRSLYDTHSEALRPDMAVGYPLNILSHTVCNKGLKSKGAAYSLVNENLKHKGKGAYIGIVTVDDVDYTNEVLRRADGTSRIACIWQQTRADEGIYYFNEQINEALTSNNPGDMIRLPDGDSVSTMMLGIAGGMGEQAGYRGIASEAEFVVAKVKKASDELQRIYGGMPDEYAIATPEMIIGIIKLVGFAAQQGRPIALCMPFNANVNPHDGSLLLQLITNEIARTPGVTIIVPTGEEADKMHHYGIAGLEKTFETVVINVPRESQNITGTLCYKFAALLSTELYAPAGTQAGAVDLMKKAISRINNTTIYSNGDEKDFLNGAQKINFRLDNPKVGAWRIQVKLQVNENSKADLWISQEELNSFITLTPSDSGKTVGSSACINNVMSVGGYNKDAMVVIKSSGRGYTWDNRVTPLLVTHASDIIAPCRKSEWASVTGTLPAASVMLGAVASLYSKFIKEGAASLPNTLVMNGMVINMLKRQADVSYPNPSQGYGIFDLQSLE